MTKPKTPGISYSKDALRPSLKRIFKAYVPRVREPHEATGCTINLWALPDYVPEPMRCTRLESKL